jgi:hypothetical protein
MATEGGPKIERDGLVIKLDAANDKSFRGEPTTNVVTNTNLDTGWAKGYQTNIVFNEIEPPEGINSPVVGHDRGHSGGYWYSYGNYAPQDPSTIYTVSLYVKTRDSNFRITFYTADNNETGRVWGSYITVPNDGNWHRLVWDSFTNPSNSQSDSLSFNFSYNGSIGESITRTWFCAPQMEVKSYATPFVVGTRGTTVATGGGWADISGNDNHGEILNGTSTSNDGSVLGALDFDGSNDYIDFGSDITVSPANQGWTAIYVFQTDTASTLQHFNSAEDDEFNANWLAILDSKLAVWNRSPGYWKYGDTVFSSGTWYHAAFVCEAGGTTMRYYVNGEAEGGDHVSNSWNATYSALKTRYVGRYEYNGGYSRYFNGKIPVVQMYSRALTASEIKTNFNSIRGRFSL